MLQRLLTLHEIAASLQLSVSTLRRAVRAGEIPHSRLGKRGQIRISEADLRTWITGQLRATGSPVFFSECSEVPPALSQPPSLGILRERTGLVGETLSYRIITADAQVALRALVPGSIAMIGTSPPYFWQRDYGVDGQIGHEASVQGYTDALVEVFEEAKRVLADDGLLFLNLGDAYYNAKGQPHGRDRKHSARQLARKKLRAVDGPGLGLPRKSLIGLPWRVALGLQAKGWTLRSSVIWRRSNALGEPTSHDRPWRTYEYVFILSKGPRYFFDRTALKGEEDVWHISARPENPYAHCAPFPLELVERCISCGCKPGGVVLDPFLGSGTTMLAALRSSRPAIGIELNDSYAEMAERRILNDISQTSMKLANTPSAQESLLRSNTA